MALYSILDKFLALFANKTSIFVLFIFIRIQAPIWLTIFSENLDNIIFNTLFDLF